MKLLHMYIGSHRGWSFISSSFFFSQDFLLFPNYLFTININKCFGIYQLRRRNFYIYKYLWKEVIDDDLPLSSPFSLFPKVSFDIKIESLFISVLEFIIWEDETFTYIYIGRKSSTMIFYLLLFLSFPRFPSLSKLFIYDRH